MSNIYFLMSVSQLVLSCKSEEVPVTTRKNRVLVTHAIHWLPHVDTIIMVTNGKISEMGSYEALLSRDGAFSKLMKTYLSEHQTDKKEAGCEEEEGMPSVSASARLSISLNCPVHLLCSLEGFSKKNPSSKRWKNLIICLTPDLVGG
ncbi:hypothetical protein DPMN_183728 [Dreissena polymorpha]|uniref:Uncharacterized protein n=1 Tax=Dreissena polymorpha TaxID=45954 RepID=A0A9D4DIN4_DREPO|nr:hypothetical protein DPMN_183728 [Dreissena polymorpha]